MTFMSRIRLNPQRAQARRFLSDPQALHAAILAGIVRQPVTERVLWRLDADQPLRPTILAVTTSLPSWEHLVEQAGWPSSDDQDDPQVLTRSYETLLHRLEVAQSYVFRLTANPVVSTKDPARLTAQQVESLKAGGGAARSRRVAHRTARHQLDWLLQRQERLGLSIPQSAASDPMGEPISDVRIIARDRLNFSKRGSKGRVTIQTATYEGRLVVDDADRLRAALVEGVGRAKAYGCGLLTLAPDDVERI